MTFARPQRQKRWPPAGQAPVTSPLGEFAATAFALAAGLVVLTALMPGAGAGPTVAAVLFFAVGAAVAGRALGRSYPHDHLGFCNGITLGRLALTAALVAPLLAGAGASWAVFAVAVIALSLDGFDGWLARRQGYVSDFGARFDMEVDSMLALVLATSAAIASGAGAIAILLGLPRYLFAVAGWVLPWMRRDLPERFSRKLVCVVQLGALIALQAPILPDGLAVALVPLVALVLAWSFAIDVTWLWRRRT
ncbi:MAG: Phosphatidylglycerophosphate synthase [Rhodobacteraceae bacterium HLUCCO18]|nr:MAG: Phosphatidylglycerophosphate synthase [Rhodobacteraceae bacterium HLUCCO18]